MSLFDRFRRSREQKGPLTKIAGGLSPIMPPADLPDRSPKAHAKFGEALAMFTVRELDQAIAAMQEVLTLVRAIDHRRAETRFLYDLGIFHQANGENAKAVDTYREALRIARAIRPELGAEIRELAAVAEKWTGIADLRAAGIPEHEWHMEILILRALSVVYGEMGRRGDADAALAEARDVLRESPRVR